MSFKKYLTKRNLIAFGCLCLFMFALGVWVLLNPGNAFTGLFRSKIAPIADSDGHVITGPYPTEEDFVKLDQHKITTIVSLLDERLPYEAELLKQEREIAAKHGIKVLNFPMASVLGQRLGSDYKSRVQAAADSILAAPGKVYLHCYLGVHRAKDVQALVAAKGGKTANYVARQKTTEEAKVEEAEHLYEEGRFQDALVLTDSLQNPSHRALLVRGWSHYRLGSIASAKTNFETAAKRMPESNDAFNGLGMCYLREGALHKAADAFNTVLKRMPESAPANHGMGMVLYRKGDRLGAKKHLEACVRVSPHNSEAVELLAKIDPGAIPQAPSEPASVVAAAAVRTASLKEGK